MNKKPNINKILNKLPTFCVPWSIDKETAKSLGFTKEQIADKKIMNPHITVQWSVKDYGFGNFTFYNKRGKVYCNNECCNKEFIKKVLCKMVDNCILTE